MNTRMKIIGIGSPFGDDQLGWVVADRLKTSPIYLSEKDKIDILVLDRPGAALISQWKDVDAVILIDAVRSGAAPGTLHMLTADDIAGNTQLTSSHGFGVASTLALARTLDELPEHFYLCGIEIDPTNLDENLGHSAKEAINPLVDQIELVVTNFLQSKSASTRIVN
ncbi:MAG: hydrogenase maturation protease [Acidiferrobacterales bacterium]